MLRVTPLIPLARITFFSAFVFTFYSAVAPPSHTLHLVPWDKAQHFIAFYVLSVLAAAAYPRHNILGIAVALSAFGALIEVVQGMPIVNRDSDFWDWVADSIAIGAAFGPLLLVWWRGAASRRGAASEEGEGPPQKNMDR